MRRFLARAACIVCIVGNSALPVPSAFAESGEAILANPSVTQDPGGTPKRDFQAAMANLHQSNNTHTELTPWPMIQGLALCLAAFCGIVFLLKKLPQNRALAGKRMRVVERLAISAKSALVLVEVDGKAKLIAVGPDHVTALEHRERARPPAELREFSSALAEAKRAEQGAI